MKKLGLRPFRALEYIKTDEDLTALLDDYVKESLESAQARIFDLLFGDDGQAYKEAQRYLEREAPELYAKLEAATPDVPAPAGATPEGWITWWPSPSSKGHEPIYSHGPKQPAYGAELDAVLRKYPVFAAPTAPSTPEAGGELLELTLAQKEYIDALPDDVVAKLPAMPGFDGDWAAEVLERAKKLPASPTIEGESK